MGIVWRHLFRIWLAWFEGQAQETNRREATESGGDVGDSHSQMIQFTFGFCRRLELSRAVDQQFNVTLALHDRTPTPFDELSHRHLQWPTVGLPSSISGRIEIRTEVGKIDRSTITRATLSEGQEERIASTEANRITTLKESHHETRTIHIER
jgi:hypothetical protein